MSENNHKCHPNDYSVSVEKVAVANLPTQIGEFKIAGYRSLTSDEEFVVLIQRRNESRCSDACTNSFAMFNRRCVRFDQMRLRSAA